MRSWPPAEGLAGFSGSAWRAASRGVLSGSGLVNAHNAECGGGRVLLVLARNGEVWFMDGVQYEAPRLVVVGSLTELTLEDASIGADG